MKAKGLYKGLYLAIALAVLFSLAIAIVPTQTARADYATFDNPGYYYATITNAPSGTYYKQAGLSPDGTKIVAVKQVGAASTSYEIVLMNADGSGESFISPGDAGTGDIVQYTGPFWSDDGTAVGFVEVHNANPNKVMVYTISTATRSYIYEPIAPLDATNADFLGSSKTNIVFWAYGPVGGADLFTWDGATLTNITNTAGYKEYEPVSNADGTKIVYWSGETALESINTTHTLNYSGGIWTKDVGFTPIANSFWAYWTTPAATRIALTTSSQDIYIYNSAGGFVTDLSGDGYSTGMFNYFGNMPQGSGGEYAITSNAGRGGILGRDIVIAAPRTALYVDDAGSDSNPGTAAAPFATIQKGIKESVAGGTVHVAAGTYDEQLVISKSLTVQGAGNGTIIKPSQLTANSFQIFSRSSGGAANTAAIIVASESGGSPNTVVLKNMLVDGSLVTSCPSAADGFEGILYRGTGGTIQDVDIQNINILTGNGMYLSPLSQTVQVEVTGCNLSSFQKNGITANFTGLTATILDNTITGIGPTIAIAQNGIQVGYGATGIVSANQVSDIAWIGEGWFPAGILFLDSSGTISGNTVTDCQGGIVVQESVYAPVGLCTIDIDGNTVSDTGYPVGVTYTAGISVCNYGAYYGHGGTSLTAEIMGNILSGGGTGTAIEVWGDELVDATLTTNTVSGWSSAGISLGGAAIGNVTISGNTISSNLNGIDIDSSVDVANVGVHCNSIVSNTVYGANNAGAGTLNAENNWWGNAGGPGVGGANPVSANIDCDPWLGAGPIQNQRTGKVYCTIQAAIDDAIPGDTINVGAGTYTEQVTINKSLHLIGAGIGSSIIQAPGTLPNSSLPTSAIVLISGSGVDAELTGFTVTGPGPSACGSISAGIYVRDSANANIHHNRIQDIRDSVFSGCQNGVGILVGRQVWATTGTATITGNTIVGYQKGGIVVDNTGSAATITNNIVTGAGTTNVTAQNGIQISRGATATLSGNTVTGNSFHLDGNEWDWGAAGILLYQSGAVTMSGANTVSNNDQNLYIQDTTGAVTLGAESFGPSTAPADIGYDIVNDSSFDLNATSVSFPGAANNFAIEDLVWHKLDEATGLVTWTAGNVYVTPLSGSIQRGIDAASTGWTVNVATGTYNENIVINKQLTVQGAGNATTFINGVGPGADIATVNITAAGNVTLSGFTITNAPVTNNTDLRFGVLTNSGTAGVTYTISHNKVIGTNNPDAEEDYGIYGRNSGKENLVITNNVVTKTGANNIVVETHQGTTDISYNTLDAGCYGTDPIFVMTLSGVDVTSQQNIHDNTIDMGTGGPFDYDHKATGITFATGVTTGVGGQFTNIEITNNKVSNLKANRRGIGLTNLAATPSAGDINGALITGNTITGAAGNVTASMGINTYGLVTNATITGNTITGVDFSFKERLNGAIIATGTKLNGNSFDNNTNGVYTERTTGTLDATNNWWGNASGPHDPSGTTEVPPCTNPTSAKNEDGTGDKVSDNVLYCPWTGMNVADCLIPLKAGWNMVSVPVTPADNSVSAVFPGVAVVYTWDPVSKTYTTPTTVEPDTGYWVAVIQDATITVTGVPVTTWTSDIKPGWNMIGSVISNASIANPNDNPDQSVQPFTYWWNPVARTYVLTTNIDPGKGYWAASVRDCTLTLQGG